MSNLINASSVSIIRQVKYCKYPTRYCKYPACNSVYVLNPIDSEHINLNFHRFPRDVDSLEKWKNICKIPTDTNCRNFFICSKHFSPSQYRNPYSKFLKYKTCPEPSLQNIETVEIENNLRVSDNEISCASSSFDVCGNSSNHDYCKSVTTESTIIPDPSSPSSSFVANDTSGDHDYCKSVPPKVVTSDCKDKFSFLGRKGILSKIGKKRDDLTSAESTLYDFGRNVASRVCKLKTLLKDKQAHLTSIRNLYNDGRFQFIEDNLNEVTTDFINAQLRNVDKAPTSRRWTIRDKIFSLSMYKRSPRLYRYLQAHFQLPSVRTLKDLLSKIPLECGLIEPVLENLKTQVESMDELDRCCTLIFDEMSLCPGFHYEACKQRICGFEDFGSQGRTIQSANHALVFMIRGIKSNYKQAVAFYFTRDTTKTVILKSLIKEVITELQNIGINIVATVCDQGSTNRTALKELCNENRDRPSPYYFVVNGKRICTIFDVPHLLKNTRNALIDSVIEYKDKKVAKMEHIHTAFNLDQKVRTYRHLPKLKWEYFNFTDSYIKMKVKVAAQQLSKTVAAAIETFADKSLLPPEAMETAEFVSQMDDLFDSLNGSKRYSSDGKVLKCAVSKDSPHMEFWSDMLCQIRKWQIRDFNSGKVKNNFKFVDGWQITLRSVMYLWNQLREMGLEYLSLRNLNQDPLENFFGQIRQHGIFNTNPDCHQFKAALKSVIINKFGSPISRGSNCKEDHCKTLFNLGNYFSNHSKDGIYLDNSEKIVAEVDSSQDESFFDVEHETTGASFYVGGYILKNIKIPDCETCRQNLTSKPEELSQSFISHKERSSDKKSLNYPSRKVVNLIDSIHEKLYAFLDLHAKENSLEDNFKKYFCTSLGSFSFCEQHNCTTSIVDKCVRLTIYKYLRDKKSTSNKRKCTSGHTKKMKKFKESTKLKENIPPTSH